MLRRPDGYLCEVCNHAWGREVRDAAVGHSAMTAGSCMLTTDSRFMADGRGPAGPLTGISGPRNRAVLVWCTVSRHRCTHGSPGSRDCRKD